jgi:hypothetical protein
VTTGDFLAVAPRPHYDRVVMNPPFAKDADAKHVIHAFDFLAPEGLLVAVLSNGVTFHTTPAAKAFRALLEATGGQLHYLPAHSFRASGTGVDSVVAVLPGPKRTLTAPTPAPSPPTPPVPPAHPDPRTLAKELIVEMQDALVAAEQLLESLELEPAAVRAATDN